MNELLSNLIESLRDELKHYGELLAQLEHQQQLVVRRQTQDLLHSAGGVNAQADAVAAARREREQHRRKIAKHLKLNDAAPIGEILPLLPEHYRGLIHALIHENNELLLRVQQRARQNQLLLSHAGELMQRFITAILPGATPATPDDAERLPQTSLSSSSIFEAIG
jgi:hypothetical protein